MRYFVILTSLAFVGLGLAAPTFNDAAFENEISKLFPRDPISGCDECHERQNSCLKYGMGALAGSGYEESNCRKVCKNYLCRKWPDCRDCGTEFNCTDANLTMPPGW
ncbi:hypothetical protein N0V90_011515 [Kalmusia sp. IMI 367209]|nr:hypothetical protein N0V90_011515 [Kalmusia sp. IMI 367209]